MRRTILPGRHLMTLAPEDDAAGGAEPPAEGADGAQGTEGQPDGQQPADDAQDGDGDGDGQGFPANTPLAEMTDAQRAAYWRAQSRKQQRLAESRRDRDELAERARLWDEHQRAQQSPAEQALEQAREQARAEARAEAAAQVTTAYLASGLEARGRSSEDVAALLEGVDPARFVGEDGQPDRARISAYVDRLAAPRQRVDTGGGRRGAVPSPSGVSAGAELYAAGRSKRRA